MRKVEPVELVKRLEAKESANMLRQAWRGNGSLDS